MKKKVYIISHSHLDREWYMPYEQHHMRVVELFDALIERFEQDETFKYFHLDGQTIPLDDYFEVKPENRSLIEKYIREGRLRIGPFYILQDVFLTSAESNTRNAIIGINESKKYGEYVNLGYFPDTFGNMGQAPQFLKQLGLDIAAFGRGVTPTGFNNTVSSSYSSQYSEMNWEGPDGSNILGILFANWYSNGNEIPTDEEEALIFWKQKLKDAEAYASTNHLLMMNGCDHQPLQKNVGEAIAVANRLFPEYEFIHSHFDAYLSAVKADLPDDLGSVQGELTSQETPGWYTLANTASSRVYLKQENVKTQALLENVAEPLGVMAAQVGREYPKDELLYAWKLLLQNHPHDSICGCSVDEVHREMMTRYAKSQEVAKYIEAESLTALAEAMDTTMFPEKSYPFTIYNTSNVEKSAFVDVKIELERILFKDKYPSPAFEELTNRPIPTVKIVDEKNNEQYFELEEIKVAFDYDLPKDGFRVPYIARYAHIKVYVERLSALSWSTFALVEGEKATRQGSLVKEQGRVLENEFVRAAIVTDGSLQIEDKRTGKILTDCLVFEDVGDIGNEYIFKQSGDGKSILSTDFPHIIELVEDTPVQATVKLTHLMEIPISADEQLSLEQQKVVDITNRKAKRSELQKPFYIHTEITLTKDSGQLKFQTSYDNQQEDHRVRVLFASGIKADTHRAESIFEAVERPNTVSDVWKNPTNPQHQHGFVNIKDEQAGMTIGNIGLNEYEVLPHQKNTIALTLLRCVGEMGDWGYFPTPEAQCLGEHVVNYSLELHGAENYYDTLQTAMGEKVPLLVKQATVHHGKLPVSGQLATWENPTFALTAVKQSEDQQGIILRGYNLNNDTSASFQLSLNGKEGTIVNLLEENPVPFTNQLLPAEIITLKF